MNYPFFFEDPMENTNKESLADWLLISIAHVHALAKSKDVPICIHIEPTIFEQSEIDTLEVELFLNRVFTEPADSDD